MIIIAGHARFDPRRMEAARDLTKTMEEASRKEPGCLGYDLTLSVSDPGFILILENWKDEAAIRFHFSTPHMAAFRKGLAAFSPQVEVKMYDVSQIRDLPR